MRIKYSPCVIDNNKMITYIFEAEKVIATYEEETDIFDFFGMPEGELKTNYLTGETDIETVLNVNPIVSAKKENGILSIELKNYILPNATEEEKFPDWIEM